MATATRTVGQSNLWLAACALEFPFGRVEAGLLGDPRLSPVGADVDS